MHLQTEQVINIGPLETIGSGDTIHHDNVVVSNDQDMHEANNSRQIWGEVGRGCNTLHSQRADL